MRLTNDLLEIHIRIVKGDEKMTLADAAEGTEYRIRKVNTEDEELNAFLFSLGCYSGEPITVVSRKRGGLVASIKDGRYNMDRHLAETIEIVN